MRERKLEESAEERKLNHVNLVSLFLFLLWTKNTEGCWHSAHMCPPLSEPHELYPGGVPFCRNTGRAVLPTAMRAVIPVRILFN